MDNEKNYENQNERNINPQSPEPIQPNHPLPQHRKKNRTLQFYKFLFYSMKIEIKMHEFVDLVRFSNQSEISLWILSLVLYFNATSTYTNVFVWIHVIHIIRGLCGMLLMLKIPRSYVIVDKMSSISDSDLKDKLFNDIIRGVLKTEVIDKMEKMRCWLIIYFILTFVNFVFDIIDFLYILSRIEHVTENNIKVIWLSYLAIAFLYLAIDLSYVFWTNSLKYSFPPKYMEPIYDAFSGAMTKVKTVFKIFKKQTDLRSEAANQINNQQPENEVKIENSHNIHSNVHPNQVNLEFQEKKSINDADENLDK
jgi:hypothetical protein